MSFIFGIIDLNGKEIRQDEINSLANAVGWEDFVIQTVVEANVALGFCHHPKREPNAGILVDEELMVLADARIYHPDNSLKLPDGSTPEEIFTKAYRHYGLSCANHLNGDFAAVVIDRRTMEVHLFRDHIGSRPLTYLFQGDRLVFASHQYGLASSGLVTTALSEEKFINELFRFKGKYAQTEFQNIFKVIPGYFVTFSLNQTLIIKYWKPEESRKDKTLSFDDTVLKIRQLIIKATFNRMEEGKIGAHVSGGIDSTGIAAILADNTAVKTELVGYSWTPEKFEGNYTGIDEREYIEAFSAEKGMVVKYVKPVKNESVIDDLLPDFAEMSIEHPVMKMAGRDGVKTLFSGWGGDEFVSLGNRGVFNHLFFTFQWITLAKLVVKSGIRSGGKQLVFEVLPSLVPFNLMHVYKAQYTDWSNLRLLKTSFILKNWKTIVFHKRKRHFGYGNRTRLALNLLEMYHLCERMDSWAIYAERYGFDYKYPLLDKDLLEFWFTIPVKFTYDQDCPRRLYREAMKGILTEKIRVRPNKQEGLRIAFTIQCRSDGDPYVRQLFKAIPAIEHLSFCRTDQILKVIKQPERKKRRKEIQRRRKPMFYLRYVELVKKYVLSNQHLTNTR